MYRRTSHGITITNFLFVLLRTILLKTTTKIISFNLFLSLLRLQSAEKGNLHVFMLFHGHNEDCPESIIPPGLDPYCTYLKYSGTYSKKKAQFNNCQ